MSAPQVVVVLVAMLPLLAVVAWHVRDAWRGRRPMSNDWCAVCQRDLRRGDVYEVHVGFDDPSEAEVHSFGGGSAMVATYCRRHAPKDARRAKA